MLIRRFIRYTSKLGSLVKDMLRFDPMMFITFLKLSAYTLYTYPQLNDHDVLSLLFSLQHRKT